LNRPWLMRYRRQQNETAGPPGHIDIPAQGPQQDHTPSKTINGATVDPG